MSEERIVAEVADVHVMRCMCGPVKCRHCHGRVATMCGGEKRTHCPVCGCPVHTLKAVVCVKG